MEKPETKINLVLSVFGNIFNLDELTNIVGLLPTAQWQQGDEILIQLGQIRRTIPLLRKETAWEFSTGYTTTWDFQELSTKFVAQFSSKALAIRQFSERYELEIKVELVVKIASDQVPSLFFDRHFLQVVHDLNAVIEPDLYLYDSTQPG